VATARRRSCIPDDLTLRSHAQGVRTPNPVPVRIVAYPTGGGIVEVDGVDVSDGTERVWFEMGDGPPVVTLQRAADAVVLEGVAVVQVASGGMAAAAEVVRSLDAQELQQAALSSGEVRMDQPAATVAAVLELVAKTLERSE
jgi:hypothetical protein